jgi:predicted ester cyclase
MSITTVETHPDALSATTAFIGASIVSHARENLGKIEEFMLDLERGHVTDTLLAESNKDLCRRFIQKIFNEGELSLIRDFMSPDVVNHELADSFGESKAPQGHNISWMTDFVFLYRHAFPDLRIEIQDQIAESDRVVTCLRMRGTQKNALMRIAASGRKIDVSGIRIDRIAGGKIVESWVHFDSIGMLRQLGALPELNRWPQQLMPESQVTVDGPAAPAAGWNSPYPHLPQSTLIS